MRDVYLFLLKFGGHPAAPIDYMHLRCNCRLAAQTYNTTTGRNSDLLYNYTYTHLHVCVH